MNETINFKDREPIWIALSDLYLDTTLQDLDFKHIALKIIDSPYTLEQIKQINKYEVFPILQPNLMSIAGQWDGFDEKWLVNRIQASLKQRNKLKIIGIEIAYFAFKWQMKKHWEQLEKAYKALTES